MSLIQAVLCDQFALVCGDQQANLDNGQILHNFRKVFKLNDNVIIGLAGVIEDNYYLFQDYLNINFEVKEDCRDSLAEVFAKVTARHQEMASTQEELSVFSLVCGWNGSGFEAKMFYIDPTGAGKHAITDVKPGGPDDAKLLTCGLSRHYDNFITCQSRYGSDIPALQKAFQSVLTMGILFDETIDTEATFELIQRPGT